MSYDRIYLCHELDPSTWVERHRMAKQGRSEEFRAEFDRLYTKGDFVVLVAGSNLMLDELYLFEQPEDAERFCEVDFAGRESIVDDKPCGFQEVSLYRGGQLVSTKSQQSPDDQSVVVALEQSKEDLASANKRRILTNPKWMRDNPERVAFLRRRYGTLTPLHERLLSFGGVFALVPPEEFDAENILARGMLHSTTGLRMKVGRDSRCHENVAALFLEGDFRICTGYALSPDGLWRQHSWAVDRMGIIETTERRELYFGYQLNDSEAAKYCSAHQRYMEAPCVLCGQDFSFDPDLVPNLRVSMRAGKLVPDPHGIQAPFCATCIAQTNEVRGARGLELIVVRPGAYGPKVSPDGSILRNRETQRRKPRRG